MLLSRGTSPNEPKTIVFNPYLPALDFVYKHLRSPAIDDRVDAFEFGKAFDLLFETAQVGGRFLELSAASEERAETCRVLH